MKEARGVVEDDIAKEWRPLQSPTPFPPHGLPVHTLEDERARGGREELRNHLLHILVCERAIVEPGERRETREGHGNA